MSGWDAPTGSWDARQEPDESGGPDEQGYHPGEPTGGYRTMPGGEGRVRAGRRGLPGYDQAQDQDQATIRPDQAPGHGQAPGYGYAPGYGQPSGYGPASGPQPPSAVPGPGPHDVFGRDEAVTGAHREPGAADAPPFGWPDARGQQDYGGRPVYGSPPGYQRGYGQQDAGPGGFPPRTEPDYPAEAYPHPGSGPSGYPQDDFGYGGFAPDSQPGFGQDAYGQHAYGPGAVAQDGYPGQDYGFPPGYAEDGYPRDGYAEDGYTQRGFEQPGAPAYDDDGFGPDGRATRGRPGARSPQRLGGMRMFIYLAAAVIGVIVIVLVVVRLTKSGTGNSATGSSAPPAGAGAGAGTASRYVIKLADNVGKYPLNRQAVAVAGPVVESRSAPLADSLRSGGAGRVTKTVIGIYDLGPVTSITSAAYKGIVFVGYNGIFNPQAAIKVVRAHLVASRVVNAGPHGGDMVCGYNTSTGADASQCVWVTRSTVGAVQFLSGPYPVKYPGASKLAVKVRDAVEVQAP